MKLSKEERTGLKIGLSKSLLILILIPSITFPQIPFKGFCKLNSFKIDSGYTKIFSFNYDRDEYADLMVYNPLETKAKIYHGTSGFGFDYKGEVTFPLQPSRLEPIILSNNMIESFAFTSRKGRSFGICKFSAQGRPELVSKIKFDSYPENLSIADINNDGLPEFLISGNSFNGLSLIQHKGSSLEENKIISGQTFLNAQFVDLNSDDIKDIAALNSVDNSLRFLYNNGRGEFTEVRKIDVGENVLALKVFDLNYDSFPDVIISTENAIKIYFGDPTHTYENVVSVKTGSQADDFVIGDFNRDGYFDFTCLSKIDGTIFTIFAKDFYSYYTELVHTEKQGIVDIIPFFSKFVYGAAFINQFGQVDILSKILSLSDDQTLALGKAPYTVAKFDVTDNGINDIILIDHSDQTIKFIIRDATGYPDILYSVNLNDNHKNIIQFSDSKFVKTFYCFTYGKRLIEAIQVNFQKFTFKREYFYTEGPIEDFVISPDNSGSAELYALFSKDNTLNLEIFSKTALRYSNRIYKNISANWFSPVLLSTKKMLVGFWSRAGEYNVFNLVDLSANEIKLTSKNKIEIDDYSITAITQYLVNDVDNTLVSFISGKDRTQILASKNDFIIYSDKSPKFEFRITDKNQLFFDKTNSLFVNDKIGKAFYTLRLSKSNNQLRVEKIFDDIEIINFVVTNLDQRKYHLIYTSDNFIKIKQLPK